MAAGPDASAGSGFFSPGGFILLTAYDVFKGGGHDVPNSRERDALIAAGWSVEKGPGKQGPKSGVWYRDPAGELHAANRVSDYAKRLVRHPVVAPTVPVVTTPPINPTVTNPNPSPGWQPPPSIFADVLKRNPTRPQSDFDRLMRMPRGGAVPRVGLPTRTGAGALQEEAYFSLGQFVQRELARRRRLADARRYRRGPRTRKRGRVTAAERAPPGAPPGPAQVSLPSVRIRPPQARIPQPEAASRSQPRPRSVDEPFAGPRPVLDPQTLPAPTAPPAPKPRSPQFLPTLRSWLAPLSLLALPSLLLQPFRAAAPQSPFVSPGLTPANAPAVQLPAKRSGGGGPEDPCKAQRARERRNRKRACRNPVISKTTRTRDGKLLQTITRELQCPVSSRRKPR